MTQMMTRERMPWDQPGYDSSMDAFLGASEIEALDTLPKEIQEYLAEEARDPEFLHEYLLPALRSADPRERIMADVSNALAEYLLAKDAGLSDYEIETGLGKKRSIFKKVARFHRKVAAKITPKFMQKIKAKVHGAARKVWKKYGNIIITVVGAVLAPFTGGASMVAASLIVAGKTMYDKRKAAIEAKKMAKADAGLLQAEADTANAEVSAKVDQFFQDNQPWFLEHDITPEKWAKLTLDEKIKLIEAGSKGTLPPGTTDLGPVPGGAPPGATPGAPGAPAGAPPAPGGAPGGGGGGAPGGGGGGAPGGGEPSYGPPPSAPGAPGAAEEAAMTGTFDVLVEGQKIGTFGVLGEAAQAALQATTPGDRFEVIANGQSTGLRIRTSSGSIDVPPDIEAKVRTLPRERMGEFVEKAEKELADKKGGGFPWWLLLVGGGAALVL